MRSKLTLSIDEQTIAKAKSLAKERNRSVSDLFRDYIEQQGRIKDKLEALQRISGTVALPDNTETRAAYRSDLLKKHGYKE